MTDQKQDMTTIAGYTVTDVVYCSQSTEILRALREVDFLPVILKVRRRLLSAEREAGLSYEYDLGKTLEGDYSIKFLAMEHLAQKSVLVLQDDKMNSLDMTIPEGGFDLPLFFTLAIEIASAIEELHAKGIIHRDINPSNIISNSAFDAVKLIDYGLATIISEEMVGFDPPADLQGTISYISPEQTGRINKPVDSRSDLYSLGVTFYKLITGRLPFETTNLGELIHSHIAKVPAPVSDIKSDLPRAVSSLIEKLINKSPDDRYQTATGVKDDLLHLQRFISDGERFADFTPGQKESGKRISLSGKLYGREKETYALFDYLNKCREVGQFVSVCGPAGIGKTVLVHELYTPITTGNGFFLSGKFDQMNRGLAYTAFADALKDFVHQCLGQDEETIGILRTAILSSVEKFGQVLTDIVPEFVKLIGVQQDIAPVTPLDTVARLNSVFSNLIKDICSVGRPLVVFLDDLQWSDSATLVLLEKIIEINPENLMLILSYRDNEVSAEHPLSSFLNRNNTRLSNIHLGVLSEASVCDWMEDIVPDLGKDIKEFVTLVITKTEGNPFYIKSLLHSIVDRNYIEYQADNTLSLDMDAIINISTDSDVVEHLIGKIKCLSRKDREFLTRISILGNRFSIETIQVYLEGRQIDYRTHIQTLVESHLLVKRGDTVLFAHDRIQQAARTMLDDKTASILHLQAGRNIKAALDARGLTNTHIEEFISHYNSAADLISDVNERCELAKINTMMGKQLKSKAAYQSAEKFFTKAVYFLSSDPFDTDYDLAIDLYTELGETLLLNLKYEDGEQQFEKVIINSRSPLDSARVYVRQMYHHSANTDFKKSMRIVFQASDALGMKLPKRMLKTRAYLDRLKVKRAMRKINLKDVLDFPLTDDPLVLAQMNVLSAAIPTTGNAYLNYHDIIISRMMNISLSEGNCSASVVGYMWYAEMLCRHNEAEAGYYCGKIALSLLEKLNAKELLTRIPYYFGVLVHHRKEPIRTSEEYFEIAIDKGLETGDYEYSAMATSNIMWTTYYSGKNIKSLLNMFPRQLKILGGYNKKSAMLLAKYWYQLLITMNDSDGDGITVSGEIIDERWLFNYFEENKMMTFLGACMVGKMQLAYFAGDYKLANRVRMRAIELIEQMPGFIFTPICHFYIALICVACYRKNTENKTVLREARRSLKELRKWAASAPANYLYKAQLVEAELFSIAGKRNKALRLYEAAIDNAHKEENSMDLGISYECMGRYLIEIGLESIGITQIQRAVTVFHEWGALNKSKRLAREYNIIVDKNGITAGSIGFEQPSLAINVKIDLDALSRTIKSLTSELKFEALLETLLDAIMQSSGATRVIYIHVDNGELQVRAEKLTTGNVIIYEKNNTLPESFDIPVELVKKGYSGSFEHVMKNVKGERKNEIDTKRETKTKSIIVIPLMRHQSVKGLVYLENDLMADAFRKEQVQFLSLLAGQAAIALENAIVFENLNIERDYSSNLIQNAPSLICGIDSNGITTFINPVIEKITGYSKHELIGKNWWELLYPREEFEQVERLFKDFAEGEVVDYEMRITCKNGDKRDIIWNSLTKRDNRNNILEIVGFGNDITDRKRMEEIMIQSEKMLSVGGLAAGMAHEINNPLAGMIQNASVMINRMSDDIPANLKAAEASGTSMETIRKYMEAREIPRIVKNINESGQRVAEIIRNMLSFARKGDSFTHSHNLVDLLDKTLALAATDFNIEKHHDFRIIEINKEYEDNMPYVPCEGAKIQQVLLNILRNGAQAMQKAGTPKPQFIIRTRFEKEREKACIEIEDNGPGMNEEIRKRIFEPFYTTKPVGEGTGLGLSVSYFIITENHGGEMAVESQPGSGSKFIIRLPIISVCPQINGAFNKQS
ncbi:MAG: AAA family ATPase [Deltaproteobacteria bacterium]|nr:AAA family ATPase [Deltaproteobacteria bacterium]